ncbi:MAG: transcription antitermination factor NusB [Fimbriimonadaceae bacterium]
MPRLKNRRAAREAALRALYAIEIGKALLPDAVNELRENADLGPELTAYAVALVTGVREHLAEIDDLVAARVREWDYDRLAAVDRNLMRIATYELFHQPDVPPKVTLDEAIELAKKYSTAESGRFVNGVLAKVLEASPKLDWVPPVEEAARSLEEPAPPEPEPEVEETELEAESAEAKKLLRAGFWGIRRETDR